MTADKVSAAIIKRRLISCPEMAALIGFAPSVREMKGSCSQRSLLAMPQEKLVAVSAKDTVPVSDSKADRPELKEPPRSLLS